MSRFDTDLLHAIAGTLDRDVDEIFSEFRRGGMTPDTRQMLVRLFEDAKAGDDLGPVIVSRGTMAAQVDSDEDLDARAEEVNRCINAWIDGFVIATRYAADRAKPKPEMETF